MFKFLCKICNASVVELCFFCYLDAGFRYSVTSDEFVIP